jgi:hypothetical protein
LLSRNGMMAFRVALYFVLLSALAVREQLRPRRPSR